MKHFRHLLRQHPDEKKHYSDQEMSELCLILSLVATGSLGLVVLFGLAGLNMLMLLFLVGAYCAPVASVVTGIIALFRRNDKLWFVALGCLISAFVVAVLLNL